MHAKMIMAYIPLILHPRTPPIHSILRWKPCSTSTYRLRGAHRDEPPDGTYQMPTRAEWARSLAKKRAEREARNVEGKMKAQQVTARMVKGGRG